MEVKSRQVELRELTPAEGMWLTQAADVPTQERVFSQSIWLAKGDAPENWKEVTEEYKNEIEALQKAEVNSVG